MYSKFKNELIIKFNSDDDALAQEVSSMFLDMLKSKSIELKALRVKTKTEAGDLNSKGRELLDKLNINASDINSNSDILNADNFSAALIDSVNTRINLK